MCGSGEGERSWSTEDRSKGDEEGPAEPGGGERGTASPLTVEGERGMARGSSS